MKITGGGGEVEDRAFEGFVAPQYRFPLHPTTYERDDRWFSSESGAIWIGCTRGGDANLAAKSDQPKPAIKKSKEGCKDQDYVKLALQQVGGDVDDAVEFLVAEEESLDQIVSHDESYHSENNLSGNRRLLCLVILHVLPEYFILSSDIFDHVVLVYSH
ncbi:hypothetical protein BUALT_Bualt05G0171800 [Buddleja alternifolia]|uniref:UBA domain-containing protein n=1 Tax=Buddleja alternifolia TaxID=168488 RepID=A0AAV6XSM7_9LAMI|nr:hypothetical protein BUALT_Bualt05G0171800 [Buddleja alternifolia]